jgi:hypothetical protein
LPIDLKRQGRAEEHLALFYPETIEEKEQLFKIFVKKLKLRIQKVKLVDLFKRYPHELSGADLESILIRAKFLSAMKEHVFITKGDLEETIADFIPPNYPHEIELQNLVAVLECTSREMVPRRFRSMDRGRIVSDIRQLKALIGEGELGS